MPEWEGTAATYYIGKDGSRIETSGQYQTSFPLVEELKQIREVQLRWDFTTEDGLFKYTFTTVPDVQPNTLLSYSVPQYVIDLIWNS